MTDIAEFYWGGKVIATEHIQVIDMEATLEVPFDYVSYLLSIIFIVVNYIFGRKD